MVKWFAFVLDDIELYSRLNVSVGFFLASLEVICIYTSLITSASIVFLALMTITPFFAFFTLSFIWWRRCCASHQNSSSRSFCFYHTTLQALCCFAFVISLDWMSTICTIHHVNLSVHIDTLFTVYTVCLALSLALYLIKGLISNQRCGGHVDLYNFIPLLPKFYRLFRLKKEQIMRKEPNDLHSL
jgi:hypothetical protein